MALAQLLDSAGQPVPQFASFLASRMPLPFLRGVRPLLNSACEQGYKEMPPRHDADLPYWKNIQPHIRNSFAFERLHRLAEETGMAPSSRALDNSYNYLEIESGGLVIHIKHQNSYETLSQQITKADYRRQLASDLNTGFGQLALGFNEWPTRVPDRAFVILFYADGQNKSTAGNIFFVLPDREDETNLANCSIESVIAAYPPSEEDKQPAQDDQIDLPPKNPSSSGKQRIK